MVQLREAGFAAIPNIVEIPQQNQIPARHVMNRVEVELEFLVSTSAIPLHDQVGRRRGIRDGNRQAHIGVVALDRPVDKRPEHV
jgi:hypothetical protein